MHQQRQRIEERTKVLIRAELREDRSGARDSCILDISSRGMLLTMLDPPGHGAFVEVVAQGHHLVGHVEWSKGRRFGLKFRDRINHAAFIAGYDGPIVIRDNTRRLALPAAARAALFDADEVSKASRFAFALVAGAVAAMLLADLVGVALHHAVGTAGSTMEMPAGDSYAEEDDDQ